MSTDIKKKERKVALERQGRSKKEKKKGEQKYRKAKKAKIVLEWQWKNIVENKIKGSVNIQKKKKKEK